MAYTPNWSELLVFIAAVLLPPFLLEQSYGLNWWLMTAVTVVIVVPLYWLYLRMRERRLGLPLTSFVAFLGRFVGK